MTHKSIVSHMAVGLLLVLLSACGGGGAESETEIKTTTMGGELQDLKKALDSGAISQKEYETQREKILKR